MKTENVRKNVGSRRIDKERENERINDRTRSRARTLNSANGRLCACAVHLPICMLHMHDQVHASASADAIANAVAPAYASTYAQHHADVRTNLEEQF